jgi:hypothetical protein
VTRTAIFRLTQPIFRSQQGAIVSIRRNRKAASLALQASEIAVASPLVIAHRLSRLARSGQVPSRRDRREFSLMGAEKVAAFHESWQAMFSQSLRIQQEFMAATWRSFWLPWLYGKSSSTLPRVDLPYAALRVMAQGVAPVRRRAVANAKRLGRTGTR